MNVALAFNVQTGLLSATFTSLDPNTGMAPDGVFDGFLPPDDSNGVGEGYVQYTIQPRAGLITGTAITQQASVVFDTNPPLNTAVVLNTSDSGSPMSSVTALPPFEGTNSFTVSWSGQDDANGSGIASYNVYVSDNKGPYTALETGTTQTSTVFIGQADHTYAFYSVATDNVGHVQATPSAAQTTTTVDLLAPVITSITSTTPSGSYSVGAAINVTLTFSKPLSLAGGNLMITLNDGGTVTLTPFTNATTVSGTYTVAAGQNTAALDATNFTLDAGAQLNDADGQGAALAIPSGHSLVNQVTLVVGTAPPIINTIGPESVNDGSALSFTITAQSPLGAPLAFALGIGAPAGAGINAQTGTFTWTPSENNGIAPGVYVFNVSATDTISSQLIAFRDIHGRGGGQLPRIKVRGRRPGRRWRPA